METYLAALSVHPYLEERDEDSQVLLLMISVKAEQKPRAYPSLTKVKIAWVTMFWIISLLD